MTRGYPVGRNRRAVQANIIAAGYGLWTARAG
jgi:hypothetical protein